ncbi:MAG TPA: hypothetical protein VF988_13065 [Verrucomicrobiae bacterium]
MLEPIQVGRYEVPGESHALKCAWGTGDWKVARTRRLESLRYERPQLPVPVPHFFLSPLTFTGEDFRVRRVGLLIVIFPSANCVPGSVNPRKAAQELGYVAPDELDICSTCGFLQICRASGA